MKDPNQRKIIIILLALGLFHFLNLETIFKIARYAPYYKSLVFLLIFLWFWFLPKKRSNVKLYFQSDFLVWSVVLGSLYIVSVFLGGFLNGFGSNPYSLSLRGIFTNLMMFVMPSVISIIGRQYLISSARPNKRILLAIILTLFFTVTEFSYHQYINHGLDKETIIFLVSRVLPILAREAILTYFTYMAGPIPAITYLMITSLPFYILNIVPDLEWITAAFIKIALPIFGMFVLHETYVGKARLVKLRQKNKESTLGMILVSIFSVMIIWFSVGVFPIYPKVIMTGSMAPEIMPGDMVLVEFIDYKDVEIGDAILYSYGDVDILHRVIAINENKSLFQTQGDNNLSPDGDWVTPEQIKGIKKGKIPFVGKPLLWLRSD